MNWAKQAVGNKKSWHNHHSNANALFVVLLIQIINISLSLSEGIHMCLCDTIQQAQRSEYVVAYHDILHSISYKVHINLASRSGNPYWGGVQDLDQ